MSDLQQYCEQHQGRVLRKWVHYFEIYERYFQSFRGKSPVVIEIGVFKGGSLQMWKWYFGSGARIIGIDIDSTCKQYEEDGIEVHIGSQDDPDFWNQLLNRIPKPDIIIDDGGHLVQQQIKCFQLVFPHLKEGGVYLCEDVHTSYWYKYGGGKRRMGTFIEFMKQRVDDIHGWYTRESNKYSKSIKENAYSISFYDSIVAVEKRKISPPEENWYGVLSDESTDHTSQWWKRIAVTGLDGINVVLQFLRLPSIYYGR
jgi:hypothetical protein